MKKALIVIALLCFAGKAESHVSHKDVKRAYNEWMQAHKECIADCDTCAVESLSRMYAIAEQMCRLSMIKHLTYLGLKQIRHDQKIPFFLRRK